MTNCHELQLPLPELSKVSERILIKLLKLLASSTGKAAEALQRTLINFKYHLIEIEDMTKIKLTIAGEGVHEVGYRVFLFDEAQKLGLEGFNALNISSGKKQGVMVLAEGSDEVLHAFIEFAKVNFPPRANVDKVETEDFGERVPKTEDYFLRIMSEQLSKGVPAILDIKDNTEKMLGKQDATASILKSVRGDTSAIKGSMQKLEGTIIESIDEKYKTLEKRMNRMEEILTDVTGKVKA